MGVYVSVTEDAMKETKTISKERWARWFGLPVEQIRFFDELTPQQKEIVYWEFGGFNAEDYVYAVRKGAGIVTRRGALKDEWRI